MPISVHQFKERQAGSDDKQLQYTMLEATLDPALSLGLSVQRRQGASAPGLMDKIATGLVQNLAANFLEKSVDRAGVSGINEVLEQKVAIKTHSPEAARKLFADAAVQDQVLRAMELPGQVTIDDHDFDDPERSGRRSTFSAQRRAGYRPGPVDQSAPKRTVRRSSFSRTTKRTRTRTGTRTRSV